MLMDEQRQQCRPGVGMDTHTVIGRTHRPLPPFDLLFRALMRTGHSSQNLSRFAEDE